MVDIHNLCDTEKGNKPDQNCCKCRQRKPSQHHEKLEEHLKSAQSINEKSPGTETTITDLKQKLGGNNKPAHSQPTKEMVESTDFIGNFLGPIGKWQLRTIFLIYLTKIPSAWFMSCIIFTAPSPMHGEIYCKPPFQNMSVQVNDWIKIAHPLKEEISDHEFAIDICNVYEDAHQHIMKFFNHTTNEFDVFHIPPPNSSKLVPCETFDKQPAYMSIITQFDLYCSRDILIAVTQFCHLFGVLCGGIITTYMMKYIEPRQCMLVGMFTQIICGNLTGWVNTFELHIFFRCLSATCCGLMYTAGGLIFTDITSGKYKIIAICMFEQFWSVGIMLLPAIASYWSSWTYLYMAISYPTIILIFLYPLIPNSPRWLISRGRVREAKEILLNAARINGKTDFSEADLEKQLQIQAAAMLEVPPEPSYWEMWRGQVKNLTAVHFCWAITIVTYYGFLLNIRNFGREYLEENTIICGICEIIGTFIGLTLILNTKRKWLYTSIFNIVASFISLSVHLIPASATPFERVILLMVTSMASKISISCLLSLLMTCTTEIVSPEKRRLCGYTSTIWTRVWLLSAPFVGATSMFGQLVPQTALSLLNILAALITSVIDTPRTVEKQVEKQQTKLETKDFYPKEIQIPDVWLSNYKQLKVPL